jgi:hypothetical protein
VNSVDVRSCTHQEAVLALLQPCDVMLLKVQLAGVGTGTYLNFAMALTGMRLGAEVPNVFLIQLHRMKKVKQH